MGNTWWRHFTVCCGAIKPICCVIGTFAPQYHSATEDVSPASPPCSNLPRSNSLKIDKEVFNHVKLPGNIGEKEMKVCQIAIKYLSMCL